MFNPYRWTISINFQSLHIDDLYCYIPFKVTVSFFIHVIIMRSTKQSIKNKDPFTKIVFKRLS